MTKQPNRKPKSFDIDALTSSDRNTAVSNDSKTSSKATKATKSKAVKRKPHVINSKAVIKETPQEAAQRNVHRDAAPRPQIKGNKVAEAMAIPARKGIRWTTWLIGALVSLMLLAVGVWFDELITDLFSRNVWLGWVATALASLFVIATLAIVIREVKAIFAMAKIDGLRTKASSCLETNDLKAARSVLTSLEGLYADRPDTARGRGSMAKNMNDILDGRDLITLAERDLIIPIDAKAQALIMASAKRVSLVTAISPRAIVDIGYVLLENTRLIRSISQLYGGRPGTIGFYRLTKTVLSHLAVTGSIAVGDGMLQQIVGHGLTAKISTRLGEGVVNGMLTARIGIAAMEVCRPLHFSDGNRPGVKDFLSELMTSGPS